MKIPYLDLFKSKENQNQLRNVLPYSFIMNNGVVLLKNGAVMVTFNVEFPDLDSSSFEHIASMSNLFNMSAVSLAQNEGWAIFFDVRRKKTSEYPAGEFENLAGFLVDQRRCENYKNYGQHFTTEHYISFVYQLPSDIEEKATSFFFKSGNKKTAKQKGLFGTGNLPMLQQEIDNFLDECIKVMGTLSLKLYVHMLDHSEMFTFLKSAVSLEDQRMLYPEDVFFFLDDYLVDSDIYNSMPLKIGNKYVPVMTVMDFPSSTYPAIFDGLNRTMAEFRWTTRFIPLDKEKSLQSADKYQKRFYGQRKKLSTIFMESSMNLKIDMENRGANELENQASEVQGGITVGDFVLGYYTSNLMVWDADLDKAKEKARFLQQVVRQCGFTIKEETFNCMSTWLGMLPGNVYSNIRRPLITTRNFSHVIPLSSAWQGIMHNDFTEETCGCSLPLCVCSTNFGTPFFLNINVKDVGHTFIFGPTGAGKSTLLSLLMCQATKYRGSNIICIDKQLSSRCFMVSGGGIYIEPGKDNVAFQPLSELLSPDESTESDYVESLMWCQQFIEGLLGQQSIAINPRISMAINETLKLLSKKDKSMHDLASFQQYVKYTDPQTGINTIQIGIEPYCRGGQFGSIFDADETNLKLSSLMTIEMGSLMRLSEKAVAPALMYIFRYLEKLWNKPSGSKQPLTFLFLDEAWLYLQHPIFANYLQEWLRTLRKKKVMCIFATQEVSAAANSSLSDTINQQCLTKIYLADESAKNHSLAKNYSYFGLSDTEIENLSTARMKRDYYYKSSLGTRMFNLDLDDLQLALLTPDHELLDKVEKQYGKNTGKPLAFRVLEETRKKYMEIGRDTKSLDYEKYVEMVGGIDAV